MAPSKLSNDDKNTIVDLYRQPAETTSTIAERYGVSNSTVSRVLKSLLPEAEYSDLIQQKRIASDAAIASRTPTDVLAVSAVSPEPIPAESSVKAEPDQPGEAADDPLTDALAITGDEAIPETGENVAPIPAAPVLKKKKSVVLDSPAEPEVNLVEAVVEAEATADVPSAPILPSRRRRSQAASEEAEANQLTLLDVVEAPESPEEAPAKRGPIIKRDRIQAEEPETDEGDIEADLDGADLDDDDDFDDDFDDDDDDDDDDWDSNEGRPSLVAAHLGGEASIQIIPLSEAKLPRTCYLVIDRVADLITCPLRDFADLGQIPPQEAQERTLPVFDNHRIARRFSRRNQRVVKIPDASVLRKTSGYLQAKGITRLLIDGRVYSVVGD